MRCFQSPVKLGTAGHAREDVTLSPAFNTNRGVCRPRKSEPTHGRFLPHPGICDLHPLSDKHIANGETYSNNYKKLYITIL